MPNEIPQSNEYSLIAPNKGVFPIGSMFSVLTEEGPLLTFSVEKKGPMQSAFLLSLVESQPPITTHKPDHKEVYVPADEIAHGSMFRLDSALPVLIGRTTFTALRIFSDDAGVFDPTVSQQ